MKNRIEIDRAKINDLDEIEAIKPLAYRLHIVYNVHIGKEHEAHSRSTAKKKSGERRQSWQSRRKS